MTHTVLFFPFTHITQHHLKTMVSFFPSFQYLPAEKDFQGSPALQEWVDKGKISPVFSSPEEMATVEQKVAQYQEWARIHKGNEVNLKSLLKENPYFTSDTNVSAIKSQIKGAKEEPQDEDSTRQRDLLFLKMAQLCDDQNERIDLKLKALDKSRDRLFSALHGLENPLDDDKAGSDGYQEDFGAMMTRERISAWSRYMAAAGALNQEGDRPVFVTASQAVFDYLESNCTDVVNALDIDKIKVHENECENTREWQHQFRDYLMHAVQGGGDRKKNLPVVDDRCAVSGQIKLGFFSGEMINRIFNLPDRQIPVCLVKLK